MSLLTAMLQVHALPAISLVLVWVLTLQLMTVVLAQLGGRALVAWNISVLGVVPIYLRKLPALLRIAQFVGPLAGAAAVAYLLLRSRVVPPLSNLPDTLWQRVAVAVGGTLILGLPRFVGALRDLRFPLWGEARVLDRVSRATPGQFTYFTASGRAYLRERFGATPEEFLRTVRRRTSTLATGSPQ